MTKEGRHLKKYTINNNCKFTAIEKYTLDNKYVETFKTIADAARSVNGEPSYIRRYLKGLVNTPPYGFIWKYEKGTINNENK